MAIFSQDVLSFLFKAVSWFVHWGRVRSRSIAVPPSRVKPVERGGNDSCRWNPSCIPSTKAVEVCCWRPDWNHSARVSRVAEVTLRIGGITCSDTLPKIVTVETCCAPSL